LPCHKILIVDKTCLSLYVGDERLEHTKVNHKLASEKSGKDLGEIRSGRSDTGAGFTPSSLGFSPANHHSNTAPYSSITTPRGVR
jgi:hypothetical protein